MKRAWLRRLSPLIVSLVTAGGLAASSSAEDKQPAHGTITRGNTIYQVHVQDFANANRGVYTARTAGAHPAGANLNVLYGGGAPGTSYNKIRSYTTNTVYSQIAQAGTVWLDPYATVATLGSTGVRTTYTLPGPPTTPDALTIVQDVDVNGTTFADSTIEVTTSVTNNGAAPVAIGIRYLWDFQIGTDDGPSFQELNPNGAVRVHEAGFTSPGFQSYRIVDNDVNASPPTFQVLGTVTGPASISPTPTAPDALAYVCWSDAFNSLFDYTADPLRLIGLTGAACPFDTGGDSAVLYYFGRDAANAITIPAGETRTVSASLFLTPPNLPPSVDAGGPYAVAEGGSVTVGATGSDPEGGALTYEWDLDNNGSYETAGQSASFSAAALDGPSAHTIGVRATDPAGLTATDTAVVNVSNAPPSLTLTPQAAASCGTASGLTVAFTDPGVPDTHTYSVDWGDGTTASGAITTGSTISHTYADAGPHPVSVTVTDDDAGSDTESATLVVDYTVVGGGILQPINPGHPTSVFKYGSTIPVKVKLAGCDGSFPATLAPEVTYQFLSGSTPVGGEVEATSTSAADSGNTMRFTESMYIFNLSSKAITLDPTATIRIIVTVPSTGQQIQADIGLRP